MLSAKMLLGIVNDILDFSKAEAGKLKLEEIDFNLNHIVEEVFKIIRTRLDEKPINLFFEIAKDVTQNLKGDPTRLKQIFINLLDNAIKFTESGEIGLKVYADSDCKLFSGLVALKIEVSDTGIGIPEDRQKSIFESYTQADRSTTRLYGGTGLGLSICKTFAEKMGGKIHVKSELGKGTQFQLNIKLKEGEAGLKGEDNVTLSLCQDKKIMIVGAHKKSAEILLQLCQDFKLLCLPLTFNAINALELLKKSQEKDDALPTMIFIDVMLEEKEAYMLAYKIKQNEKYKNIKLIAIVSDANIENSHKYVQAEFDSYVLKPILKNEVVETIHRLMGVRTVEVAERKALSDNMLDKISCEGIRILVVEDSLPNQELLKVHFENLGCVCEYANNGQEAVNFLKEKNFDMCFMDLQMPVMNGLEATKMIRHELNNELPIVALTAAETQEEKEQCFAAGMTAYIVKPFTVEELKEKIIKCTKM